jgi:hypothetical protein
MPRIDKWADLPPAVRQHLTDRMRDRVIGIPDLNRRRAPRQDHRVAEVAVPVENTGTLRIEDPPARGQVPDLP